MFRPSRSHSLLWLLPSLNIILKVLYNPDWILHYWLGDIGCMRPIKQMTRWNKTGVIELRVQGVVHLQLQDALTVPEQQLHWGLQDKQVSKIFLKRFTSDNPHHGAHFDETSHHTPTVIASAVTFIQCSRHTEQVHKQHFLQPTPKSKPFVPWRL